MSELQWLDMEGLDFPPLSSALSEPDGLLAVGGDLSSERLLTAYRLGIFPWYETGQPILWWSPDPRAVLFPENIKISRSLRKTLRRGQFSITADTHFGEVVKHCAVTKRPDQTGTWITPEMFYAYCKLYDEGHAHSIEVWQQGQLVGGLYGVAIGSVFYGESMFSHATDASKVALVYLTQQLKQWGYGLIDCQVSNPHLFTLGAEEISREEFSRLLSVHTREAGVKDWRGAWELQAPI